MGLGQRVDGYKQVSQQPQANERLRLRNLHASINGDPRTRHTTPLPNLLSGDDLLPPNKTATRVSGRRRQLTSDDTPGSVEQPTNHREMTEPAGGT